MGWDRQLCREKMAGGAQAPPGAGAAVGGGGTLGTDVDAVEEAIDGVY
jgi:hypothetical protein